MFWLFWQIVEVIVAFAIVAAILFVVALGLRFAIPRLWTAYLKTLPAPQRGPYHPDDKSQSPFAAGDCRCGIPNCRGHQGAPDGNVYLSADEYAALKESWSRKKLTVDLPETAE